MSRIGIVLLGIAAMPAPIIAQSRTPEMQLLEARLEQRLRPAASADLVLPGPRAAVAVRFRELLGSAPDGPAFRSDSLIRTRAGDEVLVSYREEGSSTRVVLIGPAPATALVLKQFRAEQEKRVRQ